jgi:hypothetical protein
MAISNELEETQVFALEVGRTHLMCSLVERHLKHLSRSHRITEWLEFKASEITMGAAISRMKKQYSLDGEFVGALHEFRLNRNKFVHEIWDLEDSWLGIEEGRRNALSFIVALYATASTLNRILSPHVIERYKCTGQTPPDWRPIFIPTP